MENVFFIGRLGIGFIEPGSTSCICLVLFGTGGSQRLGLLGEDAVATDEVTSLFAGRYSVVVEDSTGGGGRKRKK